MSEGPKPTPEPASSRPEVEVVFKEVMAIEHGKPREQR